MKVLIYALTDVFYYSYYIKGLTEIYGKDLIKFSTKEFPALPERTFAIIVLEENGEKKIVIDAFDSPRISSVALTWCNVYGKVNLRQEFKSGPYKEKLLPIGPSFGIRIWNLPQTFFWAISNYLKSKEQVTDKRNFLANYWRQFKRKPLQSYQRQVKVSKNYIYFISSLWKKENDTNFIRAEFINACMGLEGIDFEGGFAPRSDGDSLEYESLISERITLKSYLSNIKRSYCVFNTPAVEQCHGWKLGEYLALGKAIISTGHKNELPSDLEDGKHLHYVAPEKKAMEKALLLLQADEQYRKRLEENAGKYFDLYLRPEKVIAQLISHSNEIPFQVTSDS